MTSKASMWTLAAVALAGAGTVVVLGGREGDARAPAPATPGVEAAAPAAAPGEAVLVKVWKSPTCGCCANWVEHLRAEGFEVEVEDVADMAAVKAARGVPDDAASCHTALVGGYVVEGHVPASDIRRLLAERPDVAGIAAPGMPVGSPGMEVPGRAADAYDVVAFTRDGGRSVFASH